MAVRNGYVKSQRIHFVVLLIVLTDSCRDYSFFLNIPVMVQPMIRATIDPPSCIISLARL